MSIIIDTHVHLSPPEIAANRHNFLANEGSWTHLYQNPQAPMVSTDQLLAMMDNEGVEQAVVMGFPWSNEKTARQHNLWLLGEAAKHPKRLLPLASFDVLAPWAFDHAAEMLDAGMAGLGELALYDRGFGPPELLVFENLANLCRPTNKIMLVHVNEPIGHNYPGKAPLEIGPIFNLVKRCQGVRLILAHFGGGLPFFAALKKEVKQYLTMVRFDLAAMPFLYDPLALAMALKILPAHYFLLGTDFPLLKPSRYGKYLEDAGLSHEDSQMIMGLSALEFLK
ncbi:MAG: amidohydrolase family protein [Candidatus Adiutrix sp.]